MLPRDADHFLSALLVAHIFHRASFAFLTLEHPVRCAELPTPVNGTAAQARTGDASLTVLPLQLSTRYNNYQT